MSADGVRAQPFYVAPGPPRAERLLLVSCHFPPGSEVGALRWQKLAVYADERGWGVDAVTFHPSSAARPEPGRLRELPPGTRVYGIPRHSLTIERLEQVAWSAYRRLARHHRPARRDARPQSLARHAALRHPRTARDAFRAYHAWLEYARDGRWARAAARLGLDIIESGVHRAVVTCGPPHMAHAAGRSIAHAAGVPLVVDLRDPWSLVERLPEAVGSPVWFALARRHERRVLRDARLVLCNSEPARSALRERYPALADRMLAVPNGCDDDPIPPAPRPRRFTVAYAGTIYLDRDPRPLFRAAARVVERYGLTPADFAIELMGDVASFGGAGVMQLAAREGIAAYVRVHPRGTRREALAFLARAAMLVLLPQDSELAIPAKLYEYLRFPAWILVLARPESATALLLRGTPADIVPPGDVDALAATLRARYLQFLANVSPPAIACDRRFSRWTQAERLFAALERAVGRGPSVRAAVRGARPLIGAGGGRV